MGKPKVVAPPSSAYWAARLNERKQAEETLREDHAVLSRRVDQQSAQLDALSETLRRETGERKRLEALLQRIQGYLQRADTENCAAWPADLAAQLIKQELAEETARVDLVEMRRMVEMRAAELRESIAQYTASANVAGAEESSKRQQVEEKLRVDLADIRRMVEIHAADLGDLKDALTRETDARSHAEVALQEARKELERRSSTSPPSGMGADLWSEWMQAEKALRSALDDLGQRFDKQNLELRSIEESLHRKLAQLQRSEEALERMQAELEWRLGQQATRLETVSEALDAGDGAPPGDGRGLRLHRQ